MASYTNVDAVNNIGVAMCGDGNGNLYVAAYHSATTSIYIYQYEISTDTLTDISGATFVGYDYGSGHRGGVTWWDYNNTLYMVCGKRAPVNIVYCFRWDGGQNWTLVDSASWTAVLTLNAIIDSSPTRLAYKYETTVAGTDKIRGTSDGVTWVEDFASGGTNLYYDASQYNALLCRYYDGANTYVYRNTVGSTWVALSGGDIGAIHDLLGTNSNYSFFQHRTLRDVYYSTDWGVTLIDTLQNLYINARVPMVWNMSGYETVGLLSAGVGRDQVRFWNDATKTFDLDGTPFVGQDVEWDAVYDNGRLYVQVPGAGIYRRDNPIGPVIAKDFSIGAGSSPEAMDVSADDYYLYVGVLDGSNQPVLLRLLADLSADPTKVYEPGAGSAIGVQCGDESEDWVWIAGDFGGGIKVRNSIDDGATWTDDLVLVPTDGDDDMFETEDGGLNWTTLNTALPFDVGGMDRLDINLDEIVIGSDAGRDIQYSPNNAASFEDISDVSMVDVPVTDVIIG
jgi:hypothetical protein